MIIKQYTYKYNLGQEEPPIGLTLQELQKKDTVFTKCHQGIGRIREALC